MMNRLFLFSMAILLFAGPAPAAEPILLGEGEQLLILAPHPGDETLAAGGLIQEAQALDLPVRVCFFTMGDNHEIAALFTRKHPVPMPGAARSMGMLRHNEAIAAATQLGLSTNDLVFLGYPDSGTFDIWNHHWRTVPAYRSSLTRASAVPYAQALTPGSAHAGEDILDDLIDVIRDFRPTHIVIPHSADHNVDHRALYLFARIALWSLQDEDLAPEILAAPVHFTQWPAPRRFQPARAATPPAFLAKKIGWREYALASFQVTNKLAAIRRHHSQFLAASAYLEPFIRKSELFGDFPDLPLPGGRGAIELPEDDTSQFRPDENLFQELARQTGPWDALADQNATETASLGPHDNDFLGRSISGDGVHLTLSFQFQRPIAKPVALSVRLFGYRPGTPFGEMPKIEVLMAPETILAVKDLDDTLPKDSVERVPANPDEMILRIPYSLLGNPEKILCGAKLAKGRLPIDWIPWRVIDLAGAPLPPAPAPAPAPAAPIAPPASSAGPARPVPPPQEKPFALAPRVRLPTKSIPEKSEINEPVMW